MSSFSALPPNIVNIGDKRVVIGTPPKMVYVSQPSGSKMYITTSFAPKDDATSITSADVTSAAVHRQYVKQYSDDTALIVAPSLGQTLLLAPWLVPETPHFYTLADPVLVGNEWRGTRLIRLMHDDTDVKTKVFFAPISDISSREVFSAASSHVQPPPPTITVTVPTLGKRPTEARSVSLAEFDAQDASPPPPPKLLPEILQEKRTHYWDECMLPPRDVYSAESLKNSFPKTHVSSETREFIKNISTIDITSTTVSSYVASLEETPRFLVEVARFACHCKITEPLGPPTSPTLLYRSVYVALLHLAASASKFGQKSVRVEWLLNDVMPMLGVLHTTTVPGLVGAINDFYTVVVGPRKMRTVSPLDLAWVIGYILVEKPSCLEPTPGLNLIVARADVRATQKDK